MVILITNSNKHEFTAGLVYSEAVGMQKLHAFLKEKRRSKRVVGYDYETNGLCCILNTPLLLILGDAEMQYVVDCYTVNMDWLKDYDDLTYIGHNIKFDVGFSMYHFKSYPTNLICTETIDRKLYQNNVRSKENPQGFLYGLTALMQRHLGFIPPASDKGIREYFPTVKHPKYAVYNNKHILYAAGDVRYLEDIYNAQMILAKRYKLDWWLHNVEMPLISVIAECEITGFDFNQAKWLENINVNKKLQHEAACLVDIEFRKLRKQFSTGEEHLLLGGIWDRPRNVKEEIKYEGLFGTMVKEDFMKAKGYNSKDIKANINWASSDTVLTVLAALKLPAPLQGEAYTKFQYLVPVLNKKGKLQKGMGINPSTNTIEYVPKYNLQNEGWTVGQKAWQKYLVDFPSSPVRNWIELLVKLSKITTELTNFGQNYLDKVNPKTGRLHTLYRLVEAVNGRLQSGGGNKTPEIAMRYNSQNIPRDKKFRECFHGGKDYSIFTGDLTGAEVTFMCDMAQDDKLFQWAVVNDDSHSPMTQNVWRHIYLFRAGLAAKQWSDYMSFKNRHKSSACLKAIKDSTNKTVKKWFDLSETFIVTKKINAPFRVAGKNGTFGGVYGMKDKKAQETFNNTDSELAKTGEPYEPVNVTQEEGKVILFAQRKAIPKTYAMVEANVKKGMLAGFIVLNQRSYSRIWLPEVVRLRKSINEDAIKQGLQPDVVTYNGFYGWTAQNTQEQYDIDFKFKRDYEGQLRNVPISGTQADCLKEAMVEIAKAIRTNKWDCVLLAQIHDELVYRVPKYMDGISSEWNSEKRKTCLFKFDKPRSKADYNDKYHDALHCVEEHYNKAGDIIAVDCSFSYFAKLSMIQCANRFLTKFEMKADFHVGDTWTK